MLLEKVWTVLEECVFSRASTERLFNLYGDRNEDVDLPNAPAIRRENLWNYLSAYREPPSVFLLAEAPGPWGCRFSGVPITSEAQLLDPDFPVHGRQSSAGEQPHSEYCANIHWRVLAPYFPRFLTWNAVPLHPHGERPLSIRTPTTREVTGFSIVVMAFLEALQPAHVVAVGRKAERALNHLDVPHVYVRHPSQGGSKRFEEGVLDILDEAGVRV
jgi:hypothetical protein